jgi:signal transduction histidine kinase
MEKQVNQDHQKFEAELQKMSTRIIEVQEEERKRISRNLHDGIGQNLYSHLITINLLRTMVDHPLIDQLQLEATQLIEEIRDFSWELRPSVLDDLGLVPAIRSFINRFSSFYKIEVTFTGNLQKRLEITKELSIYRVIQESLTNVRKYADTNKAKITINELDDLIKIKIEDEGKGFDPETTKRGVGLFSMAERAKAVGGHLYVTSTIGKGTEITLEVPFDSSLNNNDIETNGLY